MRLPICDTHSDLRGEDTLTVVDSRENLLVIILLNERVRARKRARDDEENKRERGLRDDGV